jgi:hypothetical protein
MPKIFYTASNYNGNYAHINTTTEQYIKCKKLDLYRSIITVGNPSFLTMNDIRQNGLFRAMSDSIFQKVLLVQSNIESNRNGIHLHHSFEHKLTDYKRIISYNLGMAITKFYAEKLFNVPNLIHIESLKKQNSVTFHRINSEMKEPDLVGTKSDGSWHIFEAKGMSSNKLKGEVRKAKIQAQEVNTIGGSIPETLNACATYFRTDKIITRIEDPKSIKEKDIRLISYSNYLEKYYNSFFAFSKEVKRQKMNDIDYVYFDIEHPKLNLSIGLDIEIYELIMQKDFIYINEFYSKKKNDNILLENNNISIGQDGFIIKYKNFN